MELPHIESPDLDIDTDHIGQGSYGTVYKARQLSRNRTVVVKTGASENWVPEEIKKEVKLMYNARGDFIAQIYGLVKNEDESICGFAMEYYPYGSLYEVVQKKKITIPWSIRMRILRQIAAGVLGLHEKKILHMDLKSPNILLDSNFTVKITDFGISHRRTTTKTQRSVLPLDEQLRGTTVFVAPEVLSGSSCQPSRKLDTYAFAVTLWEVITRKWPFVDVPKNVTEPILMNMIVNGARPSLHLIPDDTPSKSELETLVTRCWASDPDARPLFDYICDTLEQVEVQYNHKCTPNIEQDLSQLENQIAQTTDSTQAGPTGLTQGLSGMVVNGSNFFNRGSQVEYSSLAAGHPLNLTQRERPSQSSQVLRPDGSHMQGTQMTQPHNVVFSSSGPHFSSQISKELLYIPGEQEVMADHHLKALSSMIHEFWEDFVKHLKITQEEIDLIKDTCRQSESGDSRVAALACLELWKSKFGRYAIRKWILAALLFMGKNEIVQILRT